MAITIERHDDADRVRLAIGGDVDMTTGEELRSAIMAAEEEQPAELVLDLSRVDFFDSTGLQVVLDADVRASADGRRLVVVPGDGEAARVMQLAQVEDRLTTAAIE
jgi:anti-sigma B factor antagonist